MMADQLFRRFSKKTASTEVWCKHSVDEMPDFKLDPLTANIFASYSGPDNGLAVVHELEVAKKKEDKSETESIQPGLIAGAKTWKLKNRKAYGISMSLYDQHPVSGKISGDPIADSFGLCARENGAIMIVADGVNWGEKSRLAARCATYGCMKYINDQLFGSVSAAVNNCCIQTTRDVFRLLLRSLDAAQATILRHDGGLTTICVAIVCPLKSSSLRAVCVLSVGDSLAFVLSRRHGMREITTGSRDVTTERDIRDAGGALGPVRNGSDPELHNLTLSMTVIDAGDIVFLTTDGISDNFDPVVTKIAISSTKLNVQPVSEKVRSPAKKDETSSPVKTKVNGSAKGPEVEGEKTSERSSISDPLGVDTTNSVAKTVVADAGDGGPSVASEADGAQKGPDCAEAGDGASVASGSEIPSPISAEQQSATVMTTGDAEETCDQEEAEQLRLRLEATDVNQLVMTPAERHMYAVKEMERIIMEFELFAECSCSAQELTGALLQHVLKLTDSKRKSNSPSDHFSDIPTNCPSHNITDRLTYSVSDGSIRTTDFVLENPELYRRRKRLDESERKRRDAEIFDRLSRAPGKLDHATIVAYEVGHYHGDEDEDYCNDDQEDGMDYSEPVDQSEAGSRPAKDDLGFHDSHFS